MEMATPTLLGIVLKAECIVSIPSFFLAFVTLLFLFSSLIFSHLSPRR